MKYEKKPLTLREQINKLKNRGLRIDNEELSIAYLKNINYYRLRAYTYPFQDNTPNSEHHFLRDDISFQDVVSLYRFDRRLRSLLFNAIEKIEAALRTRIALTYSNDKQDPYWFLNHRLYHNHKLFVELTRNEEIDGKKVLGKLMSEINRSNEDFITHYKKKYNEPEFPPSWMTLEVVSMGTLSKLFFALDKKNPSSQTICNDLGLYNVEILKNWMHALSSLRNICAHHSRVWNRRFIISLKLPNRTSIPFIPRKNLNRIRNNKLFAYLSIILYLLNILSPNSNFKKNLLTLIKYKPLLVNLKDMGFPPNWEEFSIWEDIK